MAPRLFDPVSIRGVEVRNRLWVSPMCQYYATDANGVANDWHLVHLGSFARGGVGFVMLEATAVAPEGRISPLDLGLWSDRHVDELERITRFVHSQGAAIGIQLSHAGRKASTWPALRGYAKTSVPLEDGGWATFGPSSVPYPGLETPKALTVGQIGQIVDEFRRAAIRAAQAGFDAVEIHAAHGYLLHQFLSPLSNERTDEYGGRLANRARMLLEIVDATRMAVGDERILTVRLSATEWVAGGFDLAETVEVVGMLKSRGVDVVDVTTGGNYPSDAIPAASGYQVPFAAQIRASTDVLVAAVGIITEPAQADQIVTTGQADIVFLGRQLLRDPHFALRAAGALNVQIDYIPAPYARAFRSSVDWRP